MASIVYYFIMSFTLGLGMLIVVAITVVGIGWLDGLPIPLWLSSAILLASAFFAMLGGHMVEGEKAQLLADLQLVMIAPASLLARLYRRLGISY